MQKEERELNIIDILFDCLLHWRGIILFMIVGALLLGAFGYVKSYKDSKDGIEQDMIDLQKSPDEIEETEDITRTEVANIRSAIDQALYMEKLQRYKEFFNYKNFDYTHIPTSEFVYAVKAEDFTTAQNLAHKYCFYVSTNEFIEYLNDNTDLEAEFVNELISTSMQGTSSADVVSDKTQMTDNICIFRVKVIHKNEKLCKTLADNVNEFILLKSELLDGEPPHDLVCIDDSFAYSSDYNMLNKIKSVNDNMNNTLVSMGKNYDSFSDKGKRYYELELESMKLAETEEEMESEGENGPLPEEMIPEQVQAQGRISVKYIAVGAILFACIYLALIVLFKYVLNVKIKENDELGEIYKTSYLGKIDTTEQKKKFLGFIDRGIIRLRDINKRKFTSKEMIDLASSSIKIAAKANDLSEVLIIGCKLSSIKETTKELYDTLSGDGIKATELDNILYNPESMEKLPGNKGAVIVEQIGNTLYDEIAKEIEVLKSQNIKVLGIVSVK